MKKLLVGACVAAVMGAAAPSAAAHAVMRSVGSTLVYHARDDVSANNLVVTVDGRDFRFRDPGSDGGIQPPPHCVPGETDPATGYLVEVYCPRAGVRRLDIDVGEAQDGVSAPSVAIPMRIRGGPGADSFVGGTGADTLLGGPGNDGIFGFDGADRISGGAGDDTLGGDGGDDVLVGDAGTDGLYGGPGADTLEARDGELDELACGLGTDRLVADQFDTVVETDTCEAVDRAVVAPAVGGAPGNRFDRTAPRLRAGGLTLQRLTGRTVTVLATVSEAGQVAAAGYVDLARGRRHLLMPVRATVRVDGGGVTLRPRLAAAAARRVRRALARGERAMAVVTLVATDASGNAASTRIRVRLRRS
jgi:hypothetical protein